MNLTQIKLYLERTIFIIAQLLLVLFFIRFFIAEVGQVNGISMLPTYHDNQWFAVNRFHYLIDSPDRFDVVQMVQPQNEELENNRLLLKRIIGLPGETVIFKDNTVIIREADGNTFTLNEPYLAPDTITTVPFGSQTEITIPEDYYFVLGDNRQYSTDSRTFGPVHRRYLNGQVNRIINLVKSRKNQVSDFLR